MLNDRLRVHILKGYDQFHSMGLVVPLKGDSLKDLRTICEDPARGYMQPRDLFLYPGSTGEASIAKVDEEFITVGECAKDDSIRIREHREPSENELVDMLKRLNITQAYAINDLDTEPTLSGRSVIEMPLVSSGNRHSPWEIQLSMRDGYKIKVRSSLDSDCDAALAISEWPNTLEYLTPSSLLRAEDSRDSKFSKDDYTRCVTMTCQFPRAVVSLPSSKYLKPTQSYKETIGESLGLSNIKEQLCGLHKVMQSYGGVLPTKLVLGGSLTYQYTSDVLNEFHKSDIIQRVRCSLEQIAKSGCDPNENSGEEIQRRIHVKGGDPVLANIGNYSKWIQSLDFASHWRVIEVAEFIPVSEILDEQTKARLSRISHGTCTDPIYSFPSTLSCWGATSTSFTSTSMPQYLLAGDVTISLFARTSEKGQRAMLSVESPGHDGYILSIATVYKTFEVKAAIGPIDHLHTGNSVHQDKWTHVAIEWNVSGCKVKIYINGKSVRREQMKQETYDILRGIRDVHLVLGRNKWQGKWTDAWDGQISSVKIWNRILDMSEIEEEASLVPKPFNPKYPNLWHDSMC